MSSTSIDQYKCVILALTLRIPRRNSVATSDFLCRKIMQSFADENLV